LSPYEAVDNLFQLLYLVIIIRLLLSWFPNIDWWKQPFKFLYSVSEPVLEPFRRLVPPVGGLDISPIFAFIVLQIVQTVVLRMI
jgi:YggT family protein